jgi:hypothetical protein
MRLSEPMRLLQVLRILIAAPMRMQLGLQLGLLLIVLVLQWCFRCVACCWMQAGAVAAPPMHSTNVQK